MTSEGSITYAADYVVHGTKNVAFAGRDAGLILLDGDPIYESGKINVIANFDTGSFSGAAGSLVLDGTINGTQLSGTSVFNGVTGPMSGGADQNHSLGAFYGANSDLTYAGVFHGNAQ